MHRLNPLKGRAYFPNTDTTFQVTLLASATGTAEGSLRFLSLPPHTLPSVLFLLPHRNKEKRAVRLQLLTGLFQEECPVTTSTALVSLQRRRQNLRKLVLETGICPSSVTKQNPRLVQLGQKQASSLCRPIFCIPQPSLLQCRLLNVYKHA